ncbi:ArsR/SmtB family transcription factor [Cysteiniphilum sp. 6C5]|uniref:ArsR/SmtB family transcription factor n=1 Tax=unclassified Cysteiniphilum TaxID=2610889 RepID=UPI003F85EAE6
MSDLIVMRENAQKAAKLLKAISHESRLMILCLLTKGELSVGELAEYSNLSQSAFSQHLSVLRKQKLVTTRKEAQTVYYQLEDQNVKKIISTLYEIYCK